MVRKKKGLPFVVQPRLEPIIEKIGTEESGIIEIERRGYLTVAEKSIVDQSVADISDNVELIEAVKRIAKEESKTMSEVFNELQTTEGSELLEKYATEIAVASGAAKMQDQKVRIVAATALILSRLDSDWTVDQTMDLHPDLIDGLYALYLDEDVKSLEAFTQSLPSEDGENAKK